jgi:hypothetical protein
MGGSRCLAPFVGGAFRRALAERLSLRAIARITGQSRSWVQAFVNAPHEDGTP